MSLQMTTVPRDLYYHEVAYVRGLEAALRDLVEIDRRDRLTDPDQAATDTWREDAWQRARDALKTK